MNTILVYVTLPLVLRLNDDIKNDDRPKVVRDSVKDAHPDYIDYRVVSVDKDNPSDR